MAQDDHHPQERDPDQKTNHHTKEEEMKIDPHTLNSAILFCIDEYVRLEAHRELLKDKWFKGETIETLAAKYNISETRVKEILYGEGDDVLIKASDISNKLKAAEKTE